jgi:AcrR family transcriptional regulator
LPQSANTPAAGLRERKKAKTRAVIQQHAFELFGDQGYEGTTVEQIAAAAEVSESTFFRYFPTKAAVVLQDDFDSLIIRAFRDQPAELSTIQALRNAMRAAFTQLSPRQMDEQRQRMVLILAAPELRAAMLDQLTQAMGLIADLAAERTGRSPDDLAVRAFAGAVVGVAMAAMFALLEDRSADLSTLLDQAMAHLQTGLQSA